MRLPSTSNDDAFYVSELILEKDEALASKLTGLSKKEVRKHDLLRKNLMKWEREVGAIHSPLQRYAKFKKTFKSKSSFDLKLKIVKKKLANI